MYLSSKKVYCYWTVLLAMLDIYQKSLRVVYHHITISIPPTSGWLRQQQVYIYIVSHCMVSTQLNSTTSIQYVKWFHTKFSSFSLYLYIKCMFLSSKCVHVQKLKYIKKKENMYEYSSISITSYEYEIITRNTETELSILK